MKTAEEILLEATAAPTPPRAPAVPETAQPAGLEPPPLPRSRVLIAAGLAALAVAWMLGGIFEGSLARMLGVLAVGVGVATIGLAARLSSRSSAEYLLIPAAFLAAVVASIALPNATGSTGTVPELVMRAIRNGGLLQPPVPFDPGWRFLFVSLSVLLAGALCSLGLSTRKPLLMPGLVLPLIFGGGLLQAEGSEVVSTLVSLVTLVGASMVLYTAHVAGETGGVRFELRQVVRGAAALVAVCALIAGLSRLEVLFPAADRIVDPKPQKPRIVPLSEVKDEVLFRVESEMPGPWRLGVLDSYDDDTWLLPAVDQQRMAPLGSAGVLDGAEVGGESVTASFTVQALQGFTIPAPPNPVEVDTTTAKIDRRTQVLRVSGSSPGREFTYTVRAVAPPSGPELAASAGQVPDELLPYTEVAPMPPGLATLMDGAPPNQWERLQYLRARLYEKVVAAGSGVPAPVRPERVEEMLGGAEATPFEITAAEAMLARWARIPARIGYGFHRGELVQDAWEVRPRHGANWLEAWFPGRGWVPVLGVPPRARASLSSDAKNRDVLTRPSDELTLEIYIPLVKQNPLLLYIVIRYWLLVASPFIATGALLWAFYPALLRSLRSRKRRRWARARGARDRIAVAYAEFRDAANDLNAGDPYDTPLEFLERIAPDDEHEEMAWLVTRSLWGDLSRGITDEDVEAASTMARSLRRRLTRAQTGLTRLLALTSRRSLREPFDPSMPNVWPRLALRAVLRGALRRRRTTAVTS